MAAKKRANPKRPPSSGGQAAVTAPSANTRYIKVLHFKAAAEQIRPKIAELLTVFSGWGNLRSQWLALTATDEPAATALARNINRLGEVLIRNCPPVAVEKFIGFMPLLGRATCRTFVTLWNAGTRRLLKTGHNVTRQT